MLNVFIVVFMVGCFMLMVGLFKLLLSMMIII